MFLPIRQSRNSPEEGIINVSPRGSYEVNVGSNCGKIENFADEGRRLIKAINWQS
jgi:hypothetical protein